MAEGLNQKESILDQSNYRHIFLKHDERILTLVLNRPDALNCVDDELHRELARVFYDAADDSNSDVIVLTGAGNAFSAGGDIAGMKKQIDGPMEPFVLESRIVRGIVHGLLDCPKPVISKINGDAIGIGATIALLCDISIAVSTARLGDPHVRVGLSAGDGGALIWPQLIGFAKAKHYLLTGDLIDAVEAERIGLISFVVDPGNFHEFADNYARKLARGAQTAIRYTKITANIALRQMLTSVLEAGVAYEGLSKYSADFREGVASFLEKRRPKFPGVDAT
jgi:enoyl-CoA hydratase